ncbi:hypothetical protein [Aquimarina sp. I32.4]|uniref:hypothetical protein n=1 Tax=Aquimarina sp. I32.4 TaxID=2053903 RepID=UPI0011AFAB73|nr:hypothetical protein [Aquimarina sp. I32.4]
MALTIIPFPYKKLKGVSYHGIFHKKYCLPIIEKIEVDYIVLSRFISNINCLAIGENGNNWGYEIKILDTKMMTEKVLVMNTELESYKALLQDIKTVNINIKK